METTYSASDSLRTWVVLVILFLIGVAAVGLGLSRGLALTLIFAAAIVQAYVIIRYYMKMRSEDLIIWTLVLLPVATVIVLAFVLVPDIARHAH
jgi:heme/copper-type cytochrome/quinol oxidase subunit 4